MSLKVDKVHTLHFFKKRHISLIKTVKYLNQKKKNLQAKRDDDLVIITANKNSKISN